MPDAPHEQDNLLAHFLADRDIPCPSCGYNLRDLRSVACPECGSALEVHIGLADARMGRYLAAIVSLSVPCGGFAVFLVVMALVAWDDYVPEPMAWSVWYPAVACVAATTCLARLLTARGRRRFRALTQWACNKLTTALIVGAWGALAAWLVWMLRLWIY